MPHEEAWGNARREVARRDDYMLREVWMIYEADCVRLVASNECPIPIEMVGIPLLVYGEPVPGGGAVSEGRIELRLRPRSAHTNEALTALGAENYIDLSSGEDFIRRFSMDFDYPILYRR